MWKETLHFESYYDTMDDVNFYVSGNYEMIVQQSLTYTALNNSARFILTLILRQMIFFNFYDLTKVN